MTAVHGSIRGQTAAALITAPGSGQGKSMVTAALARLHRNAGRRVRVFKHGPDYLDPMVLVEAGLGRLPAQVSLEAAAQVAPPRLLEGVRIAVARDAAFAFIYRANLDLLRAMGATLTFFSPLSDSALPETDALWLPGGYPELHGHGFARNAPVLKAIRDHHAADRPILAECGGMMLCTDSLVDGEDRSHALLGLLPGICRMAGELKALGLQSLTAPQGELRGHTYHHSLLETGCEPVAHTRRLTGTEAEPVFQHKGLTASYFHGYFPSAPALVAAIFKGQSLHH